jgi:NADPH:quinone reductase-like Zn-dependent oxidoreductase
MDAIRAVVVDPSVAGRLVIREVEAPTASRSEALVRVKAISLNRGEVRTASTAEAGWRPGWDFAGVVEQQAADGSGPPTGARVVGMLDNGAWAELLAVPTFRLAELPDAVSFAQAATLPIAGLTALWTLEHGGLLLDKRVLITGASGGVGHFACQLANHAGAYVVGVVRQSAYQDMVKAVGAHQVVVSDDASAARAFGPYDLILDSIGGRPLANVLTMLSQSGVCVNFGTTGSPEATIDIRQFFLKGGLSLYGFIIFYELARKPMSADLARLARMIAGGQLHPQIELEAPWTQIADAAQKLLDRRYRGKAVLHVVG